MRTGGTPIHPPFAIQGAKVSLGASLEVHGEATESMGKSRFDFWMGYWRYLKMIVFWILLGDWMIVWIRYLRILLVMDTGWLFGYVWIRYLSPLFLWAYFWMNTWPSKFRYEITADVASSDLLWYGPLQGSHEDWSGQQLSSAENCHTSVLVKDLDGIKKNPWFPDVFVNSFGDLKDTT